MVYRAKPVSQVDGSRLQYENCRMASISTGLDFHTQGKKTSTGAKMRSYSGDPAGGTNSDDAVRSWSRGYSESLVIRDGNTFDQAVRDLEAGHLIHLDVWHAASRGPCMSGSGYYGHSQAVAPERSADKWLVADPMCSPGAWMWWPEESLRRGSEEWAERVRRGTGGNIPRITTDPKLLLLMDEVARNLMSRFYPGNEDPDPEDVGETGGGGSIRYTMTRALTGGGGGGQAMAISAAGGLKTDYTCKLGEGRDFFADPNLTKRLGEVSKDATVPYVGNAIGETVAGGSRAVQVVTGTAYADGEARPTIVYVPADACWGGPQPVPPDGPTPVPPAVDADAIKAQRDKQWRDWLLSGNPGEK